MIWYTCCIGKGKETTEEVIEDKVKPEESDQPISNKIGTLPLSNSNSIKETSKVKMVDKEITCSLIGELLKDLLASIEAEDNDILERATEIMPNDISKNMQYVSEIMTKSMLDENEDKI